MENEKKKTADKKWKAVERVNKNPLNEGKAITAENLKYSDEENSFEFDVEDTIRDYDHPSSYDTSAKDGDDMDSDWDEANPYVGDEYDEKTPTTEIDEQGMRIDEGRIIELDSMDEKLADIPEDKRKDLDEEGYPKNDEEETPKK